MRALVVENDRSMGRFLTRLLSEEGLAVDVCILGGDAIARGERRLYDLVILERRLPDVDGLTVCREIRRRAKTAAIFMLGDRPETRELVLGLEAGADHCMVKPFEVDEFVARVRALLRRASGFGAVGHDALEVDPLARQAKLDTIARTLTLRERALLAYLLRRRGSVVTRADLLTHVWGLPRDTGSNVVDVQISRLRDKLGDRAWMIETLRGMGYRLRLQPA